MPPQATPRRRTSRIFGLSRQQRLHSNEETDDNRSVEPADWTQAHQGKNYEQPSHPNLVQQKDYSTSVGIGVQRRATARSPHRQHRVFPAARHSLRFFKRDAFNNSSSLISETERQQSATAMVRST
jgi:hypothetical protein